MWISRWQIWPEIDNRRLILVMCVVTQWLQLASDDHVKTASLIARSSKASHKLHTRDKIHRILRVNVFERKKKRFKNAILRSQFWQSIEDVCKEPILLNETRVFLSWTRGVYLKVNFERKFFFRPKNGTFQIDALTSFSHIFPLPLVVS